MDFHQLVIFGTDLCGIYILDRSNSGMETMLSVLATLTASPGGYALLPPRLNSLLDLSAEGK